ncbi:MAG: bifunctional tRNA (5-methylaminomethyl-2-thiouridine)(34)-methyltransferase MnmD/FAD-dependent 5-carboxymethylaminomethyl-2-thiouridine(34) oxidoreductase MnmC [Halioglobus sp.]
MNRDNTPWRPAVTAEIDWQEGEIPYSKAFADFYYSSVDGLKESEYVFLQGNKLAERLCHHKRDSFCLGETGFGTGLNFLLTWQAWRNCPEPKPRLHYVAMELTPLSHQDIARALAQWPTLGEYADELLDAYPQTVKGPHRLLMERGKVVLDLHFDDAIDVLNDLAQRHTPFFDAWYLDGFTPSRNDAMWQSPLLSAVGQLSRAECTLASFTAAGQVRRDLQNAGFEIVKAPGFGRKRECMRGTLVRPHTPREFNDTPWDLPAGDCAEPKSAIVLGGGLAGCSTAAALARRGLKVTLLEESTLANGGSANDQGVLYTRLSHKHSSLVDFALQSFLFAAKLYRGLFANSALETPIDGELCGCFQRLPNADTRALLDEAYQDISGLAQIVSAREASELTGIEQTEGGYWLPQSGWLHPGAVCRALLRSTNIEVLENYGKATLEATNGGWQAASDDGRKITADCAVIATGTAAVDNPELRWLPTKSIRGQTTHLPSVPPFSNLRSVFCHRGHIAPGRDGEHCIGASFNLEDDELSLRRSDHQGNLDQLAAVAPEWQESLQALDSATLGGKVRFRCTSPDYLPLTGPVPDHEAFLQTFAALRNNARQHIATKGNYVPGLYLNTAHGSRGLSSTPLAAELLASQICGEPSPLQRSQERALAPARFLIRDLVRSQA